MRTTAIRASQLSVTKVTGSHLSMWMAPTRSKLKTAPMTKAMASTYIHNLSARRKFHRRSSSFNLLIRRETAQRLQTRVMSMVEREAARYSPVLVMPHWMTRSLCTLRAMKIPPKSAMSSTGNHVERMMPFRLSLINL